MKIKINSIYQFVIKYKKFFEYFIFIFLCLTLLFGRTFMGIIILNYRLGEYLVAISLLFFIFLIFSQKSHKFPFFSLLITLFLISNFINYSITFSTYTFKASSYIWTIGFVLFGIFIYKENLLNKKIFIVIFNLLAVVTYVFFTLYRPEILFEFFKLISDKANTLKPSDVFSLLLFINFFNKVYFDKKTFLILFFTISAFFIPLLIALSRGAFLGYLVFIMFELYFSRKTIFFNKKLVAALLISSFSIFYLSSLVVSNVDFYSINEANEIPDLTNVLGEIGEIKNTFDVERYLYVYEGRLYSSDGTMNWRLDIWQDVVYDLKIKNQIYFGYGFNEIIPIMLDGYQPGRLGRDGLNENVHNIFFTVLARGGLFHLISYVAFIFFGIKKIVSLNNSYEILKIVLPFFLVSFFDVSMDGVQFPFIFYVLIGYIFMLEKTNYNKVDS